MAAVAVTCTWCTASRPATARDPPRPGRASPSARPPRRMGASAGLGQAGGEVVEDEAGDLGAEGLAGLVVEPGVLAGEDAAEPGFVRGGLEAAERPGGAAQ